MRNITILLLLMLTMTSCSLFESKIETPIEMVAFGSLSDEESQLILASPKDSIVKKVSVNDEIKSVIDKNYNKEEVYSVTLITLKLNLLGTLSFLLLWTKKQLLVKVNKALNKDKLYSTIEER